MPPQFPLPILPLLRVSFHHVSMKTHIWHIEASFGSKQQEGLGIDRMDMMLQCYRYFMENLHKKNKVSISDNLPKAE